MGEGARKRKRRIACLATLTYLLQVDGENVTGLAEGFKGLANATQDENISHLRGKKKGKGRESKKE